jgi:hypothetical protein
MIKALELIKSVAKFKATIRKPNSQIVENFGKMYTYLVYTKKDEIPTELWLVLVMECVREACIAANRANIRFKDFSHNWNTRTIGKSLDLIKLIEINLKEGDSNAYKVNVHRFFTLLFKEEGDPSTILYCWTLYYNRVEDGKMFIQSEKDRFQQLLAAATEEEVDKILTQATT